MKPAFTLVELLAVILAMAVLAALAVPSMNALGPQRRAAGARQVLRDLTFARDRATTTGITHWVSFSASANTYSLLVENPASPGRAGAATITDPATQAPFLQRLNINDLVTCTLSSVSFDSTVEVSFDRLGRPGSSSGSLLAADGIVNLSGSWRITVSQGSGLATLASTGGAP